MLSAIDSIPTPPPILLMDGSSRKNHPSHGATATDRRQYERHMAGMT